MNFEKKFNDRLLIGEEQPGDRGFIAFVIPATAKIPDEGKVSLANALTNNVWYGSFVFATKAPLINSEQSAKDFLETIYPILGNSRQFIWLPNPLNIAVDKVFNAEFSSDGNGTSFQQTLNTTVTPSLTFVINSGMGIKVDGDGSTLNFDGGNDYRLDFSGPSRPEIKQIAQGSLPCSGSLRGCVQFTCFIQRSSLQDSMQWGFQMLIPNPDAADAHHSTLSTWLPFADPSIGPSEYLGFNVSIDPCDSYNDVFDPCKTTCNIKDAYASRRTFLDFTGKNFLDKNITLTSYYCTAFGQNVVLIPGTKENADYTARLVFSISDRNSNAFDDFHLCPEGDFIISIPTTTNSSNHYLVCGMSGTEFFKVTPQADGQKGDILRFISRKPAFVPDFPFPVASPVGLPFDFNKSPFTDVFRTSWATVVNTSGKNIFYVSQPGGAALYGKDLIIEPKFNDLLGHNTPGFEFKPTDTDFFPMLPYSGMLASGIRITANDVKKLEQTVISPQRRRIISALSETNRPERPDDKTQYDTTPSGLIVKTTTGADGGAVRWDEVTLGWNIDNNQRYTMAFVKPPDPLVNALQSSDVFLVAANNKNTGNFMNTMGLGNWVMQADTGTNQKYGDYRNVMIIKGRRGKLYDPEHPKNSLIANPLKWTQPQDFSIPSTGSGAAGAENTEDEAQLVILSQWLQTYFENAKKQSGNSYFNKFNDIAGSDSWTGILFLRVDVKNVPVNLKGIMAGITAPQAFNAHHLGIEISPVKKGKDGPNTDEHPSAIFGLIYYLDPQFTDTDPQSVKSIAPSNNNEYNYRLLSLKVLFENTSVKSFESYSQLTLNKLFGTAVTRMRNPGNIYKNILLAGTLQINNGNPLYTLSSQNKDAYYFDSNIVHKIEINNVTLSTRSGKDSSKVESWFALSGFIDYYCLQDEDTKADFDIFSFGNITGSDELKKGLSFSNLGILMSFPADNPANNALSFNPSEIAFDLSISTPRENCLYNNMLLDMESLVVGTKDAGPKESGYLDVLPDLRLGGSSGGEWFGLRMKLNMGTPGELAGKINLNSYLLLSWATDSSTQTGYKAGVGISLPGTGGGAKMISLQNVMKLSIGQIRLMYIKDKASFLLLFTEIALKFLGLLKIPPGGNTLFYLFGNPNAAGKTSGLGWYAMYMKDEKAESVQVT